MEKFSAWRDKGTGIHPFFQPKPKVSRIFFRPLIDLVLALIRFTLLLIVFPCYFLIATFISILPLPGVLTRIPSRIVNAIGCRTILYILGFWHIPSTYQRLSRLHPLPRVYPPGFNISSGDLIICNKQSYPEILYLGYRFDPVFTAVSIDGKKVKQISLFRALFDSMNLRRVYQPSDCTENLQDILRRADKSHSGPVVLFPEGVNSNGKGLLEMTDAMKNVSIDKLRTHVIGFKYYWHYFSPNYTVGSVFVHLYHLCGQVKNTLIVRYLSPNDIPQNPNTVEGTTVDSDWDQQVFQSLANLLRTKRTKINQQDLQEFLDYWDSTLKTKSYTKKNH